jgi:hypothetical protein
MKGGRIPAVEVLQNSSWFRDDREGRLRRRQGGHGALLAEGSQTFEQDLAKLIKEGVVSREALAQADSPTNLLWRLQNEQAPVSRVPPPTEPDSPSFTEITLDVVPETAAPRPWSAPAPAEPVPAVLMSDTLRLVEDLIARPSVTPADHGCLDLIAQRLTALGFVASTCPSARRLPRPEPVGRARGGRPGPRWSLPATPTWCRPARWPWNSDPSCPATATASSSAAARRHEDLGGRLGGGGRGVRAPTHARRPGRLPAHQRRGRPSVDGTVKVVQALRERGERLDCCIVGEPTSSRSSAT